MVAGGHISSDVALLLQLQVLRLVRRREIMGHHLVLNVEIILEHLGVAGQEVPRVDVSDQDGLSNLHWLALALKSIVRVEAINDPLSVERVTGVQGCLLESGHGGEDHI